MSVVNFYAIIELYCPAKGTFFTPMGELGIALHEMWEVTALPMGSLPYEEYFPCEAELTLLEKQEPALFETYRELMCHFYICLDVLSGYKGSSNNLKSWADYLFSTMEEAPEEARFGVVEEDILQMMRKHDHGDIILEEDDIIYEKGDTLKRFHHQARQPISQKALLAGFLSVCEEVCSAVSFQQCHFPDDTTFGRSLGARSLSGATSGYSVLHTMRSSCTNGSLL